MLVYLLGSMHASSTTNDQTSTAGAQPNIMKEPCLLSIASSIDRSVHGDLANFDSLLLNDSRFSDACTAALGAPTAKHQMSPCKNVDAKTETDRDAAISAAISTTIFVYQAAISASISATIFVYQAAISTAIPAIIFVCQAAISAATSATIFACPAAISAAISAATSATIFA
jgi:hypothetical protein